MSKKICMFVWNHFTNDARVLRECTALVDAGYKVKLIAIHDPKDKKLKQNDFRDGFEIVRVKRYPFYMVLLASLMRNIKKNKITIVPLIILLFGGIYLSWQLSMALLVIILLIAQRKVRTILIRLHIIIRMIYFGYKDNADVYHSNDLNTMPQGYVCSKILRRKRKLVYDSHEVQSSRTGYGEFHRKMEKVFIDKADVMIMTNHTRADYVQKLYKIEKPKVVQNYPFYTGDESINNKYDLHKLLNIEEKEPILLYQGGIQAGRGLEQIINSIEYIEKGIVVFLGDGKLKPNLIKMVKDKNLESKVRFLDKVPVDELKYYTADAYLGFQVLNNVCFNHYSACSNKLFEYMMSQVPVVACSFPEIQKVVEDENIGICVDSHNPREIAEAVNTLLNNEKIYQLCRRNCYYARNKYNWNNEKDNFIKIYDELLSKKLDLTINQGIGA